MGYNELILILTTPHDFVLKLKMSDRINENDHNFGNIIIEWSNITLM